MLELAQLFPDVPEAHLEAARGRFYAVEVGRGITLMEEGERDAAVLVISEGHVAIRTGEFEIATIGPGGLVGEIGLFRGALRTATAKAVTPCVFVVLDKPDYKALLDQGNAVAYAIEKRAMHQLVIRLRDVDDRISSLSQGSVLSPAPAPEVNGAPRAAPLDMLAVLGQSRLFDGAPIGVLDDIALRMEPREFQPGEALCRQGTPGDDLFMLADGRVEVVVTGEKGHSDRLAELEPGDVFGMAALLQNRPRMASCVAIDRVVALRMGRPEALELSRADTLAGSVLRTAMIRALGDQITYANAQFASLSLARKQRTAELMARLGIEAHGRHLQAVRASTPAPAPGRTSG